MFWGLPLKVSHNMRSRPVAGQLWRGGRWKLWCADKGWCRKSNTLIDFLQRDPEIGKKANGIVIPLVEGKPGEWSVRTVQPGGDERGFAESWRCRDQR